MFRTAACSDMSTFKIPVFSSDIVFEKNPIEGVRKFSGDAVCCSKVMG